MSYGRLGKGERAWAKTLGISLESGSHPGPGSYIIRSPMGEGGPKYAIRPKTAATKPPEVPGPGQYGGDDGAIKRTPSIIIGKEERKNPILSLDGAKTSPGPGAYGLSTSFEGRQSYTFGSKREVSPKKDVPGPGAYMA